VRGYKHAYWLAWREYNKVLWQNTGVEFEALSEAPRCVRGERVLVADNTRSGTQDGEVMDQAGLTLTLSQPVDMTDPAGYTIFLQLPDATVESIRSPRV
jgi:predicted phage tail protein